MRQTAMGRMAKREDRAPSQRATAEFREQVAEKKQAQIRIGELEHDLRTANNFRSSLKARVAELEDEVRKLTPPTLAGLSSHIAKLNHKSSAFYDHVDFGYRWLRRFDPTDVAAVAAAAVRKVQREEKPEVDIMKELLGSIWAETARKTLLHEHEVKCAKYLSEHVYTNDHFSILRLVGVISKRVCGLIEQSLKWEWFGDGTKKRRMMCEGSTVPAPTIFSKRGIGESETQAQKDSGLTLAQHKDRKGADICGMAYSLDRAIFDSVRNTTRAGGMCTKGTLLDPHLICVTGDGAGLTARDSGVRVAHFPG